jgi:hypothetical protein
MGLSPFRLDVRRPLLGPLSPADLNPSHGSSAPLIVPNVPRFSPTTSSGSKIKAQTQAYLGDARASHSHRTRTEVFFSALKLPHKELSIMLYAFFWVIHRRL